MMLRVLYRFRWYRRFSGHKWVLLKDCWYRLDKIPVTPLPLILEDNFTSRQDCQEVLRYKEKEKTNERNGTASVCRDL